MAKCPHCGGTQSIRNDDRGEEICTGCGAVLSESAMVDQIAFAGGGRMVGSFIDTTTGATRGFAALYNQRASRQQTLERGWYNLERVANRLGLAQSLIEAAKRMYHLALNRNFTLGRNNLFVVSACLYAACRRDHAAHMMIDFSDAVLAPVRSLTQVFMKLIRALRLNVPSVDPSLFMERFAQEMKLGDMTMKVAQTGVRLVQAMARDWLVTGRRPLGLCAAALLIAARFHGQKINSEDIDTIFRISYCTVDKRLAEFQRTAVAALPAKDFEKTDLLTLPALTQPPCVYERKRQLALTDGRAKRSSNKKRRKALKAALEREFQVIEEEEEDCERGSEEIGDDTNSELAALSPLAGKIAMSEFTRQGACRQDLDAGDVAIMATDIVEAFAAEGGVTSVAEKDHLGEIIRSVAQEAPHIIDYINQEIASARPRRGSPLGSEEAEILALTQPLTQKGLQDDEHHITPINTVSPDIVVTEGSSPTLEILADEGVSPTTTSAPIEASSLRSSAVPPEEIVATLPSTSLATEVGVPATRAAQDEAIITSITPAQVESTALALVVDQPMDLSLSDVEEEVVDSMLLSEKESRNKMLIWDELTKDFIQQVYERQDERKMRAAAKSGKPFVPRKRREPLPPMKSAVDAVRATLSGISPAYQKQLDESVLEELFAT